jgi:hypothetical protein
MRIAQTAGKIRAQINAFSGKLSQDLGKVARRFVGEMIYGIQTRQAVRLSEIGRSLNERTALGKTINRLSRNLDREGLWENVTDTLLVEASTRIANDTLLVLDPSDITKPYAKSMENLADVRDASEKKIGKGYSTINIVGVECGTPEITPMLMSIWSQEADGFQSENTEILNAIDRVRAHTGERGIWVIDRGGDRRKLIEPFLERSMRFVIRMRGDRDVVFRGRRRRMLDVALGCPLWFAERVIKEKDGEEQAYHLEFGFRKVKLPGSNRPLWLLVLTGLGKRPLMLLTNEKLSKSRRRLWWFTQAYLSRWRIEDTIRFVKQSYGLEDIRVRTWRRLRNMMAMVLAASYFAAVYLGSSTRLEILTSHVLTASKRIFGIPEFRHYAVADGICEILSRSSPGPKRGPVGDALPGQLVLFDDG